MCIDKSFGDELRLVPNRRCGAHPGTSLSVTASLPKPAGTQKEITMQINFDQDIAHSKSDDRKRKRFRVTISATFIVDDDEFHSSDSWEVPKDELPVDEDEDYDEEAMAAQKIFYDGQSDTYQTPRDIEKEPVTAEEMAEQLTGMYESSFEFVTETDREDQFTAHIVEVEDKGKDIVSPQTRNKSESTN